jgi:beta-xylosidase
MLLPPLPRRGASAIALAAAIAACAGEPGASRESGALDPTAPPNPPPATSYRNPVYAGDFPDPFVLVTDSIYYAYATNGGGRNVPALHSPDLVTWTPAGDVMPALPAWAESGRGLTWAPAVLALDRRYLLFFTARDRRSGLQCIGRAESGSPGGPFLDPGTEPFLCQTALGGSIDASVARSPAGELYLVWKNDGNCCGKPVSLWSQQLDGAGRLLVGRRVALLHLDRAWEGPLIEGPTLWEEGGRWRLLYSANRWDTSEYATGYAECDTPLGPCTKLGEQPVIVSDAETAGPGGAEVFTDRLGRRWIVYHGWEASRVGYGRGGARSLRLEPVLALGQASVVLGPTSTEQMVP